MDKPSSNPEDTVFGKSPLGGNAVEGTTDGCAEVRDTDVQGVPLVWDERVKAYISEQAKEELDDRDVGQLAAEEYQREEEFRFKAGYRRSL